MIDTVLLSWPGDSSWDLERTLPDVDEVFDPRTGEILGLRGQIKSLSVRADENGTTVLGSLPRFAFGDNSQLLTPQRTREVLEEIGDVLGLSAHAARVYKLHYGFNLPVRRRVEKVIGALGIPPSRWSVRRWGHNSVSLGTKTYEVALYDKRAESSSKRRPQPTPEHGHVLRAEVRLNKKVKREIGPVFGRDLSDPSFHSGTLIPDWRRRISRLKFEPVIEFEIQPTFAKTRDALASLGIQHVGLSRILHDLAVQREGGIWAGNERNASRIVRGLKALAYSPSHAERSNVEVEFRQLVEAAADAWDRVVRN